jgi:hypothetical protein
MPFGKCQDEELGKIVPSYLYCASEAGSPEPSKRRWTRGLPETSPPGRLSMTETVYGPFTVRERVVGLAVAPPGSRHGTERNPRRPLRKAAGPHYR